MIQQSETKQFIIVILLLFIINYFLFLCYFYIIIIISDIIRLNMNILDLHERELFLLQ